MTYNLISIYKKFYKLNYIISFNKRNGVDGEERKKRVHFQGYFK